MTHPDGDHDTQVSIYVVLDLIHQATAPTADVLEGTVNLPATDSTDRTFQENVNAGEMMNSNIKNTENSIYIHPHMIIQQVSWAVISAKTNEQIEPITNLMIHSTTERVKTHNDIQENGNGAMVSFLEIVEQLDSLLQRYRSEGVCFLVFDADLTQSLLEANAQHNKISIASILDNLKVFDIRVEFAKWTDHVKSLSLENTNGYPYSQSQPLPRPTTGPSSHSRSNSLPAAWLPLDSKPSMPFNPHKVTWSTLAQWIGLTITTANRIEILLILSQELLKIQQLLLTAAPSVNSGSVESILTQPSDNSLDFKAFVAEKSPVVFFSRLPPDTTHADLVAHIRQSVVTDCSFELWTLKATMSDDSEPSTALVEFASHELARNFLKSSKGLPLQRMGQVPFPIKVSPSSRQLVQMARSAQILAKFPTTKSRPRVGDWNCPACQFSNFQRRTSCWRCNYSTTFDTFNTNRAPLQLQLQSQLQSQLQFQSQPQVQQQQQLLAQNYAFPNGINLSSFRVGDWNCTTQGCNYHNFAKNIACLRCGSPRSSAQSTYAK